VAKDNSLSAKQRAFVTEYVKDHNATKAAERAGYSKKTAYSQGQRLLKKAEIKSAVESFEKERGEKAGLTVDWFVSNLMSLHEKSVRTIIDQQGNTRMDSPATAAKCLEMSMKYLNIAGGADSDEGDSPITIQIVNPNASDKAE
jgi:phage terminase small subunit